MDRRTKDSLRVAATALGVATGLLALASTAQTPDGYIHASFGGPLDVFTSNTADVLSIGDGANDMLMIQKAGLGIAFHGKPKLREAATSALTGGLDRVLFLLGLSAREIRRLRETHS